MDLEWVVTLVKRNWNKVDTPITTNPAIVVTKDPPYAQRLAETGMIPQHKSDFLKDLKKN